MLVCRLHGSTADGGRQALQTGDRRQKEVFGGDRYAAPPISFVWGQSRDSDPTAAPAGATRGTGAQKASFAGMHRLDQTRRLVLAAIAVVGCAATVRTAHAQSSPLSAFADSLERAGFSGTILVADTQRTRFARAMGFADQQRGRRLTLDDRWRWASVSKQVTAALVMREVDAGRIALDTPAVRYLPAFTGNGRERITVRQLLQHSSGLPNMDQGPTESDGTPSVYRETKAPVGDAAFERVCAGALAATPGERFDYNNCDYLVLGALLRARTGRSPSELASALIGQSTRGAQTVLGYVAPDSLEPPFNLATYGSAAAMTGTVHALLAFDRVLLGRWLSPSTRTEMWRGEPRFGYAALGAWSYSAPLRGCAEPVAIVERRGAVQGVQVRNVLLPERGLIVIIFTNRGDIEFGEVWQQAGLMFDVLSRAMC